MKVSYRKLWILCAEREISKGELRKKAGVSSLSVLMKIAEVMDCNAGDMMDFVKDDTSLPEINVDEVW